MRTLHGNKKKAHASQMRRNVKTIAVLCGGPSPERGISLNSARSLADHLAASGFQVVPYYFDYQKKPYRIERAHLYSNTPSDFDFKLHDISVPLTNASLIAELKKVDLVFPAIHGRFGEDGELQSLLEKNGIPFVGSPAEACARAFDKYDSSVELLNAGFSAVPTLLIERDYKITELKEFFKKHVRTKAIVKPARSGSSIGVTPVTNVQEAMAACADLWEREIDDRLVVQPFVEGIEFTVIVFENRFGLPVALFPTEIEVDYKANEIFDYRKKYLPTRDRTYFCPPRFEDAFINTIRTQAAQLFKFFCMHDYARFDGWILENGEVLFTDFNPVSGMEQNSFLFQQAAQVGMSHQDVVRSLVARAADRYGMKGPTFEKVAAKSATKKRSKKMSVLFGGGTAERQVSVMSGTNAWLKLRGHAHYQVSPYVLEPDNDTVWHVPYYVALNHTVEEIIETCKRAVAHSDRNFHLRQKVVTELGLLPGQTSENVFVPHTMTLQKLLNETDFLFIGLHGGMGEDGTLQAILEKKKIPFNGPGSRASALCMDKYETGRRLSGLEKEGIYSASKKLVSVNEIHKAISSNTLNKWWSALTTLLGSQDLIVKPHADGCSAGCVRLKSAEDVATYVGFVDSQAPFIPAGSFKNQTAMIDMPSRTMTELLFERWITTDSVRVENNSLVWKPTENWIEVTVGVLGHTKDIKVLSPSLTVSRSGVLSLEEKFQGGTGVNITPPPAPYVKNAALVAAKKRIKKVTQILGVEGYSRLDAFMHTQTGEVIIIEVNTLPALTPSTVLYHQGLAEKPVLFPRQLLEKIVSLGETR